MREPLHSLGLFESFSHFQLQDEHNASNFFKSAAQRSPKNRCKDRVFLRKQAKLWGKMLFLCKHRPFRHQGHGKATGHHEKEEGYPKAVVAEVGH